jgi:uncharacterized protein YfaP (DUF2135 family)
MKTKLFVAIGMLVCTSAFASWINDPRTGLTVKKTGTGIYQVFYTNSKSQIITLSILDANGKTVFFEKIKAKKGFARPYNFSGLGEGEYTLQIEDQSGIKQEHVSYYAEKPSNLFNVIRVKSNKYLVTSPRKDNAIVDVKIYNENGDLLYSDAAKLNEPFAKVYRLDQVSGRITFKITDNTGERKVLTF